MLDGSLIIGRIRIDSRNFRCAMRFWILFRCDGHGCNLISVILGSSNESIVELKGYRSKICKLLLIFETI